MSACTQSRFPFFPRVGGMFAALIMAACTMNDAPPSATANYAPPPATTSLGSGQVKTALILPLSASGNAGNTARAMKNAAEMALEEFDAPNVQIIVKDDRGTPQGAQAAAQEAINDGAEIIIGPLFSPAVAAAGQVAAGSSIPVIGFSSDSNVASRGVYLLSFLPQSDVERIISHAVRSGKKSFAALLPDNAYGSVVEGAFQEAIARHGARVVALERYGSGKTQQQEAGKRIAAALEQADAIFIPDGSDALPELMATLRSNGLSTPKTMVLGSGLWDDPTLLRTAGLEGAVFAAPDKSGFSSFSARYSQRYGSAPVRTATLAYDATLLVAALTKTQGVNRFSESALTTPSGFQGLDGLFRFRADGTNQRGLAVYEVQADGSRVISPAPRSFDQLAGL